jgi:hypothetical protein
MCAHLAAPAAQEDWEFGEDDLFRDDGYSGAILRRPRLDRLRDAAATWAPDLVLVTARTAWHATTCIKWRCSKSCRRVAAAWNFWIGP